MAACSHPAIPVEFRIAQNSPAPNYFAALVQDVTDSIYVSNDVELSLAQIDSINPSVVDRGLVLNVWFSTDGKERLAKMTESNIGRRLVVRIGSQVMSAPEIVQRMAPTDRPVSVAISVQKDSAEVLARQLKYPK